MDRLPKLAKLSPAQERAMIEARMAFMDACPFFSYYYWDQMVEYPTYEVPTAATDSRRVFFNPEYVCSLRPLERCFVLAHEVDHAISRHPQRMKAYRLAGKIGQLPYDGGFFNVCADYTINARLIANNIGMCNPAWLYAPDVKGTDLVEDVYKKKWVTPPPPPPQGQPGQGQGQGQPQPGNGQPSGQPSSQPPGQTYGEVHKGARPDKTAGAQGGRFDEIIEPYTDPVTGKEDVPEENEFKEAIARAAAAAKAIGKMPGQFQSLVDEILEPQVNWREHVRMLVTGKIGKFAESWNRPNRRRLVLNPIIIAPGKRGFGAELVVCAIDCSGSVSDHELATFFAEIGAVLADCKPRRVMLIWCDAAIQRIDEARSLDDLMDIRIKGVPGRGGTSFEPPFEHLEREGLVPDTLIYLTDMYGSFPNEPKYPVVWCATSEKKAPWGETVRVQV